jgi:hypothetical protein
LRDPHGLWRERANLPKIVILCAQISWGKPAGRGLAPLRQSHPLALPQNLCNGFHMQTADLPNPLNRRLAGKNLIVFDSACVFCSTFFRFMLCHGLA